MQIEAAFASHDPNRSKYDHVSFQEIREQQLKFCKNLKSSQKLQECCQKDENMMYIIQATSLNFPLEMKQILN